MLVLFGRIFFWPFKGVSDWADAEGQGHCLALAVASSTSANALGLDIKVSIWKFTERFHDTQSNTYVHVG